MIGDQDENDQVEGFLALIRASRRLFLDEAGVGLNADAQLFFNDAARFSHANATTHCFDDNNRSDPMAMSQLEGRRQLYLRMLEATQITDRDLRNLVERGG